MEYKTHTDSIKYVCLSCLLWSFFHNLSHMKCTFTLVHPLLPSFAEPGKTSMVWWMLVVAASPPAQKPASKVSHSCFTKNTIFFLFVCFLSFPLILLFASYVVAGRCVHFRCFGGWQAQRRILLHGLALYKWRLGRLDCRKEDLPLLCQNQKLFSRRLNQVDKRNQIVDQLMKKPPSSFLLLFNASYTISKLATRGRPCDCCFLSWSLSVIKVHLTKYTKINMLKYYIHFITSHFMFRLC